MQEPRISRPTPSGTDRKGSFHVRVALAAGLLAALVGGTAAAQSPSMGAGFPITVIDDDGTRVTLDAAPERVISLSPANTEIVFGLGEGDRLVGGSAFDDFPAEAAPLPDVVTFDTGVIMEQVVALEPDLVLAAGNNFTPRADIERMRELGYPVIVVYAETVDEVLEDVQLIGDALGDGPDARAMVEQMNADVDEVIDAVAATPTRPRTFYQIGSEPEIYAPAPDSFVADMVELAGGDAVTTTDPAVFSIPVEQLVAADHEVIVVGDALYGVCPDAVMARPGWETMTAVVNGDVRAVNDIVVTRPGPRLAEGLASLALAIHPDLDLPGIEIEAPPCSATASPVSSPDAVESTTP
jgi:iron complex transport system substrate-binding protein